MQNVNVVSRRKFPVLSNGALVFAVNLILFTENGEAIHRSCTCIKPPFSTYKAQLAGKPSAPFQRA